MSCRLRPVGDTDSTKAGQLQEQARLHQSDAVPFTGTLRVGACGPNIRLMQGALVRAHVRYKKPARCFGPATGKQLQRFQATHHVTASGVYGPRTHAALSRYYSQRARIDLQFVHHKRFQTNARRHLLIAAHQAWIHRTEMAYSQSPSRGVFPQWPRVPRATDCSGYVTWLYEQANLVDPSGLLYGYVGWTGTLADPRNGFPVNPYGLLRVGDLVFYGGGYPYGHVAMVIKQGIGARALVTGHGSPGINGYRYGHSGVDSVSAFYRAPSAVRRYF